MFADGQGLIDVIQPKTDLTNVIKGAKAVIQKVADATQIRKKGLSVFLASPVRKVQWASNTLLIGFMQSCSLLPTGDVQVCFCTISYMQKADLHTNK